MPRRKASSPKPTSPTKRDKSSKKQASKLKVLSSKTVFKGRVFSVTSDRVKEPSGIVAQRDVIRHSGSVVILALDESGPEPRVLLERQYRYAAGKELIEIPAGRIDPGEDPLAAGKRELLEETGYTARTWKLALFYYPSPGFMDETMTVYLARGLKPGNAQPEEDETIECYLVPISKVVTDIMSRKIQDGKTIASVLWARAYLSTKP